ncbi:hypothetical protein PM082_024122 [Marasmius tenuissimus]|nr:hypothetical protein PM082_024122 [Marasmius tenuissimus]
MNFNNLSREAIAQLLTAFLQSEPNSTPPANPSHPTPSANTTTTALVNPSLISQPNDTQGSAAPQPPALSFSSTALELMARLGQTQSASSDANSISSQAGPSQTSATPSSVTSIMASTSASTPADTAIPQARPIAPYSSVTMLNAVANGNQPPESRDGRPLITMQSGFPAFDIIRRTNQARLEHSAEANPKKRPGPRSKAKKGPTLQVEREQQLTLADCLKVADDGQVTVNLAINVYPPQPSNHTLVAFGLSRYLVKYTRHSDSFNAMLDRLHLYHEFHDINVKTTVMAILSTVVEEIREYGYDLDLPQIPGPSAFQPHEQLPLQLLAFTNSGRPNGANKTWKLATGAFATDTTLEDLLRKKEYAHNKLSVTPRGFFELNTIIRRCHYPLAIKKSLAELQLMDDNTIQTHRCIPKRVYTLFRDDAEAGSGSVMITEEDLEIDCGDDEQSDDEEEQTVAHTLLTRPALTLRTPSQLPPVSGPGFSRSSSASVPSTASGSRSSSRNVSSTSSASASQPATHSASSASSISASVNNGASQVPNNNSTEATRRVPTTLWSVSWQEKKEPGLATILKYERTSRFFEVVSETYTSTHNGNAPPSLEVKGRNYVDLALQLKSVITQCLLQGDFTVLLSMERTFALIDGEGSLVSSGNGVERETISTLCNTYLSQRASTFFVPHGPQFSTLAAVNVASARWMSTEQRLDWGIVGTLVALSLIHGMGTEPLNPLLLIFFINDTQISSLQSNLVLRWFPDLHAILKAWTALGHEDDIRQFAGHFSSYHDCDIASLRSRSPDQHRALGWEMLHNAIIGSKSTDHPAIALFLKGFRMPCDKGYNFTQIARAFQGGSVEFVSEVYNNYISHYSNLRLSYQSLIQPETFEKLIQALEESSSFVVTSFQELFRDFLEGTGCPSIELMNNLKGRLNPIVNLEDIDEDTFRMRMFCWAATGAPFVLADGLPTRVILVEDDDEDYGAGLSAEQRLAHLNAGVCKFKSCFREMRIPVSFLLHLLSIDYTTALSDGGEGEGEGGVSNSGESNSSRGSSEGVTLSAKDTVEHWLLASILDNIGENNLA